MYPVKLLLASSSPYRRGLLQKLHLDFVADSPEIDEAPFPGEAPEHLATRLSQEKAAALAEKYPEHLIIGSDQVAVLDGKVLPKPGCRANTIAQLAAASGKIVYFYTGICVFDGRSGQFRTDYDRCAVTFKKLSQEQIARYVDCERPFDCAGGFKAESLGIALFERITGDDPNALVGLPLIKLIALLEEFGVKVL
ncbi:MAG: Maf family protein [Gammaproteobacteria bacterium]